MSGALSMLIPIHLSVHAGSVGSYVLDDVLFIMEVCIKIAASVWLGFHVRPSIKRMFMTHSLPGASLKEQLRNIIAIVT